jgi:hypothetical protein
MNECFESHVPKFVASGSNVKCLWFDRNFRNVNNTKTKPHKLMREIVAKDLYDLYKQKGPGNDGITPSVLKKLVSVVQVPLTFLLNLSFSLGVLPGIWKVSFNVQISKIGEKHNISCYLVISILSTIPKMFEKMVYNKLTLNICAQMGSYKAVLLSPI